MGPAKSHPGIFGESPLRASLRRTSNVGEQASEDGRAGRGASPIESSTSQIRLPPVRHKAGGWIPACDVNGAVGRLRIGAVLHPGVLLALADAPASCSTEIVQSRGALKLAPSPACPISRQHESRLAR